MNSKVELDELDSCRRRLRVEVDPAEVARRREAILSRLASRATLPGFRPGRAPRALVDARFREEIKREILEAMLPESYRLALESEKLEPVGDPEFDGVELGADRLAFEALFEVAPRVEIDGYEGFSLENRPAEVSDQQVDQVFDGLLERNPGLRARALDIRARDELRRDVRARLEEEARLLGEHAQEQQILEQLLARARVTPPEGLVRRRALELAREEIRRTVPDFGRKTPAERDRVASELVEQVRPRAEKDVKASFVLQEVARREKVEATDEEIDRRLELIARVTGRERDEVVSGAGPGERADLAARIRAEKTLALLKRRSLLLEKPRIIKA